jgi:RNA polymerase sigma-70 factor (ECF subfamily)
MNGEVNRMEDASSGANDVVINALSKYADMVRRICFMYLKNKADVEDIFQDVFLKLLQHTEKFENDEHEKAWLCRVTINRCKDFRNTFFRKNVCSINDVELLFEDKAENVVMQEVLLLPQKYKNVIYLFYFEGYSVPEISKILCKKENTVYSYLHRAKAILRDKLGGDQNDCF